MRTGAAAGHHCYLHEAVYYGSDQELLDVAVPFLQGGIEAGEPTLVGFGAANTHLVRAALPNAPIRFLAGGAGGMGSIEHGFLWDGFVLSLDIVTCPPGDSLSTVHGRRCLPYLHAYGVTGTASGTWQYTGASGKTDWPDIVKDDPQLKDYDVFVASYYTPLVDIAETAEGFYFQADLPGARAVFSRFDDERVLASACVELGEAVALVRADPSALRFHLEDEREDRLVAARCHRRV